MDKYVESVDKSNNCHYVEKSKTLKKWLKNANFYPVKVTENPIIQ